MDAAAIRLRPADNVERQPLGGLVERTEAGVPPDPRIELAIATNSSCRNPSVAMLTAPRRR
jgi:hypothetical protein